MCCFPAPTRPLRSVRQPTYFIQCALGDIRKSRLLGMAVAALFDAPFHAGQFRRFPVSSNSLRIAMPSPDNPKCNHLIAALPEPIYERLLPDLEPIAMPLGWVVYESGGRMRSEERRVGKEC